MQITDLFLSHFQLLASWALATRARNFGLYSHASLLLCSLCVRPGAHVRGIWHRRRCVAYWRHPLPAYIGHRQARSALATCLVVCRVPFLVAILVAGEGSLNFLAAVHGSSGPAPRALCGVPFGLFADARADPLRIRGEDCGTAAAPVRHRCGTGADPVRNRCRSRAERRRNAFGTPAERRRNAGGSAPRRPLARSQPQPAAGGRGGCRPVVQGLIQG